MTLLRKTTQFVLPVEKPETGVNQYDIYPAHDLGEEKIFCDYMSLARRIAGSKRVIIDGYVGVRFDIFSRELNKALETLGIRPVWWNTGAAMKEPAEIDRLIEPIWAVTIRSSDSGLRSGSKSSSTGRSWTGYVPTTLPG